MFRKLCKINKLTFVMCFKMIPSLNVFHMTILEPKIKTRQHKDHLLLLSGSKGPSLSGVLWMLLMGRRTYIEYFVYWLTAGGISHLAHWYLSQFVWLKHKIFIRVWCIAKFTSLFVFDCKNRQKAEYIEMGKTNIIWTWDWLIKQFKIF